MTKEDALKVIKKTTGQDININEGVSEAAKTGYLPSRLMGRKRAQSFTALSRQRNQTGLIRGFSKNISDQNTSSLLNLNLV